jgi:hypothetical protein
VANKASFILRRPCRREVRAISIALPDSYATVILQCLCFTMSTLFYAVSAIMFLCLLVLDCSIIVLVTRCTLPKSFFRRLHIRSPPRPISPHPTSTLHLHKRHSLHNTVPIQQINSATLSPLPTRHQDEQGGRSPLDLLQPARHPGREEERHLQVLPPLRESIQQGTHRRLPEREMSRMHEQGDRAGAGRKEGS